MLNSKLFPLLFSFLLCVSADSLTAYHQHSTVMEHPPATKESWKEVADYARNTLPQEGTLRMKSDGYVYLKVDDQYIHSLFPKLGLKQDGFREPEYFRRPDSPGAHISVFYADEHVVPKEIGQTFHFEVKDIVIVKPSKKVNYAVLEIQSPELEQLRQKYGLNAKLHNHEYHISLAKKTIRSLR